MAIDFPSSPSNGTTYTYNGVTYVYNSTTDQWIVQGTGSSELYVLKTGDTMTGSLTSVGYSGTTGTFSGVLKVDGQSGGSRLYEGTGAFADSLVIDGAPIQGASGSIVFTTNSAEVARIKGDGTADFNDGKVQILPNGALIAIRDTAADATYGKATLNGGFANGTRVPFLCVGNVGGTVKATFAVESSGTTKIGGTLPDSPNITLNADGTISSSNSNNAWIERSWTGASGDAPSYTAFQVKNNGATVWKTACDGTTFIGGADINNPNIRLNADGSAAVGPGSFGTLAAGSIASHRVYCWDPAVNTDAQIVLQPNGIIRAANTTVQPLVSERRLKKDIKPIDAASAWETVKSVPFYSYSFIESDGSKVYGPMADEVPAEMVIETDQSDSEGVIRTYDNGMLQARLYTALQTALTRIEALEAQLSQLTTTGGASS